MFSLIAVIGKNRELGKQGKLIFEIPEDMEFFRKTTMGHKVLMGRKTWESLPGKLGGRENIVVSRHEITGADEVINDLQRFIDENKETLEEIFVIGGEMIYRELLPFAETIYLTEVDKEALGADTWFPEFDLVKYDREVLGEGEKNRVKYQFVKYNRKEK